MNIQHATPMTPLRARMIADMSGRNLGPASQTSHLRACKRFAPDVRDFQRHLMETGTRLCCTNRLNAEFPLSPDGLIPQLP